MNDRTRAVVIGGALAVCLVAGSPPRIVGDGGEYMAQAMNFASFGAPSFGRRAIAEIEPRVQALEPALGAWRIETATVASTDRRRDFLHFWFYALVATPALWIVDAVAAPPTYAFAITNVAFVLAALWVLLPRVGAAGASLILASPLVWWFDKPHTEVFTVALVAIALALMRDRPAWALVAAGMAATQNLPVGIVFAAVVVHGLVTRRAAALRDRTWLTGAAVGGALAVLHPAYTYWRHGTPSLLLYATRPGFPTVTEITAIVTDLSMGLVGNAPFFLAAVLVAAVAATRRTPRSWGRAEMIVAISAAAVFLYAAARTSNTHHGATPSLSRYALWLLPLAVPLFTAVRAHGRATAQLCLSALALVSAATSVFAFHPAVVQNSREPTWLASWTWTRHPTWNDPLPEVFSETLLHVEGTTTPAATALCEKVLLAAPTTESSGWPVPCYPVEVPRPCQVSSVMCYANRSGDGYIFAKAPGREGPPTVNVPGAWPLAAEPHVRALYDEWRWWEMSRAPSSVAIVREVTAARAMTIGDDSRLITILRPRGPGASVRLRPVAPRMVGRLIDAETGEVLQPLAFTGTPGDLWTITLPADRPLQILALRAEGTLR